MRNGFSLVKTKCEWTPGSSIIWYLIGKNMALSSSFHTERLGSFWLEKLRCCSNGFLHSILSLSEVYGISSCYNTWICSKGFVRKCSVLHWILLYSHLLSLSEVHGTLPVPLDKRAQKILVGANFLLWESCIAQRLNSQREGWGMFQKLQHIRVRMLLAWITRGSLNGACFPAAFLSIRTWTLC